MSENLPKPSGSEEVDLGQLFKLIGNAFERLFKFLSETFNKLFIGFVWAVFFLKKHFLKIAIAGIIGFGIAMIKEKIAGPVYVASVTVNQNYDTGENLYDLVNYYNSLTNMADSTMITKELGASIPGSTNFVSFEIEPMVNENVRITNYDRYIRSLDSTLAANIDYETYLKNTMEHHYGQQKISIKTKEPRNLLPIFEGIINKLSSSQFYKVRQKRDLEELTNTELAVKQSLIASDSLKNTYKRVLEKTKSIPNKGSQTSINIEGSEGIKDTKEYELFQNDLALRRELVLIERAKQDKEALIEIISSEFSSGAVDTYNTEIFGKKVNTKIFYALCLSFFVLLGLMGIEFFKYLEKYKNALE